MTSNTSLSDVFEYMGKGQIVPKDVVSVRFHPSVVEVEEEAFEGCSVLKKVVFNVGVKKIGDKAFYNCTNLSEVVFNEGLHTIGRRAFYGTALEIISLPSTLTEIDLYAFSNCKRIREVSLNEKNTNKIDACAFDQSLQRFKFTGISARLENIIQYQPGVGDKIDEVCGTRMRSSDVSSEEEEHDNDGVQHVPQLLADAVMGAADAGEEEVEAVEVSILYICCGHLRSLYSHLFTFHVLNCNKVPIVDNGALDMELWDLKVVLPIEQINDPFGQQCETTGCRLAACCIWASNWNPTTPWYTCLDCQEKDFEGWPENRDIPLRVMSSSLRNVMIERVRITSLFCTSVCHSLTYSVIVFQIPCTDRAHA